MITSRAKITDYSYDYDVFPSLDGLRALFIVPAAQIPLMRTAFISDILSWENPRKRRAGRLNLLRHKRFPGSLRCWVEGRLRRADFPETVLHSPGVSHPATVLCVSDRPAASAAGRLFGHRPARTDGRPKPSLIRWQAALVFRRVTSTWRDCGRITWSISIEEQFLLALASGLALPDEEEQKVALSAILASPVIRWACDVLYNRAEQLLFHMRMDGVMSAAP